MKPFSTKRHQSEEHLVFNYRLSRFRRVSENAFGIFVSRFRLFLGRINIKDISSINKIILAAIVLHTMLCEKSRASFMPVHYTDHEDPNTGQLMEGQWIESVPNSSLISQKPVGCRGTRNAEAI